jgi:hypothetical protein
MPAASFDQMPRAGFADDRTTNWGELTIDFAKPPRGDLAPLLKGLPDDLCQCPHWGYLFKGKIVVRYADHEESIEAGQAFYMPPGHAPEALEECELIQLSPAEQMRETLDVMRRNMQAMQEQAGMGQRSS